MLEVSFSVLYEHDEGQSQRPSITIITPSSMGVHPFSTVHKCHSYFRLKIMEDCCISVSQIIETKSG